MERCAVCGHSLDHHVSVCSVCGEACPPEWVAGPGDCPKCGHRDDYHDDQCARCEECDGFVAA